MRSPGFFLLTRELFRAYVLYSSIAILSLASVAPTLLSFEPALVPATVGNTGRASMESSVEPDVSYGNVAREWGQAVGSLMLWRVDVRLSLRSPRPW